MKRNKRCNEYYIFDNIVFVKFTNCDEYFMCDPDDWEKLGGNCWLKDKDGYAIAKRGGKMRKFHRLVTNCPDGLVVDHLFRVSNGVCDNRKNNLKIGTTRDNNRNKGMLKRNTSGVTGVRWNKQKRKWVASIGVDGKFVFLGYFKDKSNAIEARKRAEEEYWRCK